jgi:hypothetical protein
MPVRWLDSVLSVALVAGCGACGTFDPSFGYLNVSPALDTGSDGGGGPVQFGRDIRPIIALGPDAPRPYGCKQCHYSTEPEHIGYDLGGLDLSTLGALRRGGATSGTRIVVPGDPDSSVIVQKLRGTYPFGARMPRVGIDWDEDDMALITGWIEAGALGADDE